MRLCSGPWLLAAAVALAAPAPALASCPLPVCQQLGRASNPDCDYNPDFFEPSYPGCGGPRVLVDTSHGNRFQITPETPAQPGLYWGFARLLSADGYQVVDADTQLSPPLTRKKLRGAGVRILVIAGPIQEIGQPEASEIRRWVETGGRLLLILDHGRMFRPAEGLLAAWGIELPLQDPETATGPTFSTGDGSLDASAAVVAGAGPGSSIERVTLEAGTALRAASCRARRVGPLQPALRFPAGSLATGGSGPNTEIGGDWQGVGFAVGAGRVYVSGSAGHHTARVTRGGTPFGMQALDDGHQTEQYLLNVVRWLDSRFDPGAGRERGAGEGRRREGADPRGTGKDWRPWCTANADASEAVPGSDPAP